jgi:hypothetical protein
MPTTPAGSTVPRGDFQAVLEAAPLQFTPIADQIFTPTRAPHKRGGFNVIPVAAAFETPDVKASPKSGANRSTFEMGEHTFRCRNYKHEEPLNDDDREFYDNDFQLASTIIVRGNEIIKRAREIRVAAKCHNTTLFTGAANFLSVTTKWDVAATADPIGNIAFGKGKVRGKCGMSAMHLQIGWATWHDLSLCQQVLTRLQYTQSPDGLIPLDSLASALGVEKVVCPGDGNVKNTAKEGQTPVLGEIWDPQYAFLYVPAPAGDIRRAGVGRTLYWDKRGGMGQADTYYEEQTEDEIARVKSCTDELYINGGTPYAFLFGNIK